MQKQAVLNEFQKIPYIGKACSEDLYNLGFRKIEEFKDKCAEDLFDKLCKYQKTKIDRCMLYVLRMVISYANTPNQKLKWWDFKE